MPRRESTLWPWWNRTPVLHRLLAVTLLLTAVAVVPIARFLLSSNDLPPVRPIAPNGGASVLEAPVGETLETLFSGARILISPGGRAVLRGGGTTVPAEIVLERGGLRAEVGARAADAPFDIRTATARASASGVRFVVRLPDPLTTEVLVERAISVDDLSAAAASAAGRAAPPAPAAPPLSAEAIAVISGAAPPRLSKAPPAGTVLLQGLSGPPLLLRSGEAGVVVRSEPARRVERPRTPPAPLPRLPPHGAVGGVPDPADLFRDTAAFGEAGPDRCWSRLPRKRAAR